jgi:hypothetical protein
MVYYAIYFCGMVTMEKKELIRRLLLSILFGLAGFFITINLSISFKTHGVIISLDWGAIFPLIIALAYGPAFALVTGVIGLSSLYPFVIWPNNGYGCCLASFNNLLYFIWHGYVSRLRKKLPTIYNQPIIAQIPYAFYYGISLYFLYPILFSFNPPPWNTETIKSINNGVLLSIIYKSTFVMMMNVIIASSLLRITSIRQFLHIPFKNESRLNGRILLISLTTSILFWFIFIIISNALKNYAGANFIDMSDSHEAITLLVFVIFGFVAGTVISHYAEIELLNSRELAEKNRAIQNMANELELKVNERTNELSELNKKLRVSLEEREIFSLKLKELNAQLEATLNALPDKMFDLDIEGIVFDYRTTKPESLYASPADFLGKNISDFLPADVCAIIKKALFTAQRDGLCSGIIYKLNFAEETRWFELSIAKKELITDSGDRFVSLVRDVTDRKKTEEDLRLRSEELEAFNRIMIDREMRVIDLKEEVNALCKQLSIALPYPQDWKEKR